MTGSLIDILSLEFGKIFEGLGADEKAGAVAVSKRPEMAQFQCNGAMASAKKLGKNPREVAQAVVDAVDNKERFADLSIAGPGFINITLTNEYLAEILKGAVSEDRFGIALTDNKEKVIVDYGGPNVAKPMHVGHLRSSIIGDSIVRLMKFAGHEVLGDIHLGDWGTQMGMLIIAIHEDQPKLPYFDANHTGPYPSESPVTIEDLQEIYPKISGRCKGDDKESQLLLKDAQQATVDLQKGHPGYRALWQHFVDVSIAELKKDFGKLGIEFDLWYGESAYHDRIPKMVLNMKKNGHAVEDQGAVVIHVQRDEDKKDIPPVMLLKSDGGTNYHTTDLATIQQRFKDLNADRVLYVVDKRQSLHFEQCFRAADKTGLAKEEQLEHHGFGTMNGSDGKPFKTRAGGVMRLSDLIAMMRDHAHKQMMEEGIGQNYSQEEQDKIAETVGMAALKYADLMNAREADYVFDIERFTQFKGKTGAYICYAAVRIKSILRKAAEKGFESSDLQQAKEKSEVDLMLVLLSISDFVQLSIRERKPHYLCEFLFELGQAFSRFYNDCHIMTEEDETRRGSLLRLCEITLEQMELVMGLLGMEAPERM